MGFLQMAVITVVGVIVTIMLISSIGYLLGYAITMGAIAAKKEEREELAEALELMMAALKDKKVDDEKKDIQ